MATTSQSLPVAARPRSRILDYPAGGVWFDLIVALLSTWFIVGIYVDGWAHRNGQVDNTFFTPWHALLYSGVAASGVFLAFMQMRYVSQGYAWRFALPKGYLLSLIGVVLFLIGGGFDFFWHEAFGFEANREALYSPAHLILAASGVLILTGPLRAAWTRSRSEQRQGWVGYLPVLMALTLLAGTLTFFTMDSNLYTSYWVFVDRPARGGEMEFYKDMAGIGASLITPIILMGTLLFAIRRWGRQLPFGAVTFVVTGVSALALWLTLDLNILPLPPRWILLGAALAAGLVGDVLLRFLRDGQSWVLRVFAFATPFVWLLLFYVLLNSLSPMWWRIHLSLGMAFVAGVIGLLLSYLTTPPAFEPDAR